MTDPTTEDAIAQRATTLAVDLLEQARISALEKIGDDRGAALLATSWLQGRRRTGPRATAEESTTMT